jgi:hypothetical protein
VRKFANSVKFVLPKITAPAARNRATTAESRPRPTPTPLPIQILRILNRLRIDDPHRVDAGPARVDLLDPLQVRARELLARQPSGSHLLLRLGGRQRLEVEVAIVGGGRRCGGRDGGEDEQGGEPDQGPAS